eukprot:COSAG02_NODE_5727_length_4089_cov_2.288471_3_plen_48_part_00
MAYQVHNHLETEAHYHRRTTDATTRAADAPSTSPTAPVTNGEGETMS